MPEVRNAATRANCQLIEKLVPEMTPAGLASGVLEVLASIPGEVEGFSVLGVGAKTAKLSLDEHRAVDVRLNEAFARALRESGKVPHLAFMSAVGANPNASPGGSGAAGSSRYSRVKGESEEAVKAAGPAVVSVFRPAMIMGSQHTPWILEKTIPLFGLLTPGNFKSIRTEQIAQAMIATAKRHPPEGAVYHYPEMMELIAGRR